MLHTMYDDIVVQMSDKFAISIHTAKDALNDMNSYNYKMVGRYFGGVRKMLSDGTTHAKICNYVYSTIESMEAVR